MGWSGAGGLERNVIWGGNQCGVREGNRKSGKVDFITEAKVWKVIGGWSCAQWVLGHKNPSVSVFLLWGIPCLGTESHLLIGMGSR